MRGFEETTVEDIAHAAGISRRTFFRYFRSKNDVVWGDFDELLQLFEASLGEAPSDQPWFATLRDAVIQFNSFPAEDVAAHRQRMALILYVPALQAHSTLRYGSWRAVVAAFVARRLDQPESSLAPQLIGHVALAAAVAAYEQWLAQPRTDLSDMIGASFDAVSLLLPSA